MSAALRRRLLTLLGVCALAACSAAPADPEAAVLRYLRCLGRDPIRAAALLTDGFHERHGLRVVTSAEAEEWMRRELGPGALPPPAERRGGDGRGVRERSLHQAQIAWLSVHIKDFYRETAAKLEARVIEVRREGDSAEVAVALAAPGGLPFLQRFFLLRRGARHGWRIDRVEQEGVGPGNLAAAYVAHPSEELRRQLAAQLRLRPD